jgi:hypothetical protein
MHRSNLICSFQVRPKLPGREFQEGDLRMKPGQLILDVIGLASAADTTSTFAAPFMAAVPTIRMR